MHLRFQLPTLKSWRSPRRLLAGLLLIAALSFAAVDIYRPHHGHRAVVTAAKDVPAGATLGDGDVKTIEIPKEITPPSALTNVSDVIGKTTAGPIARGEVVVDTRFVGASLAQALTGEDSGKIVAVTPANQSIVTVLNAGDVVDVVAADTGERTAAPVAHNARIAATSDSKSKDKTVFLALPAGAAEVVAALSMDTPLGLVISGPATTVDTSTKK